MPFRTPEKIPQVKRRLVHSDLWHKYETHFAIFDARWEQSREQHVFRVVWYWTLRGKALKISEIEKISGVPRQTLQQGKNGMLPRMERDGRIARYGRSRYFIPWEMLNQTTDQRNTDGRTAVETMDAEVHKASVALRKIDAAEARVAKKQKPRKRR